MPKIKTDNYQIMEHMRRKKMIKRIAKETKKEEAEREAHNLEEVRMKEEKASIFPY